MSYTKRQYQKFRRQRAIKGGRQHIAGGVERIIEDAVERLCVKYQVTRPLVLTTILADALNIKLDPNDRYDTERRRT